MQSEQMPINKVVAPVVVGKLNSDGPRELSTRVVAPVTPPVMRGARKFWLDGSVVLLGTSVLRTSDLERVLPQSVRHWSIAQIANWWAASTRNPGALYVEDASEGWSACLPDPLGGAIAFSVQRDGHAFISTDTVILVETAKAHGIVLEKDPLFQIERLVLGNGGLTKSSYSEVESVDPFQYFVMEGHQIRRGEYDVLRRYEELSLYELFGELRQDVQSAVHAIANSESAQVISHLTGGFDSRIVLSAILSQGLHDKVSVFCSGPEGSTDRVIADGLSRAFGLKRSNGAGLTAAPTQSMSERLMGALFSSGGVTNTGPSGREIRVDVSAMGGGYGEVLRTFFGGRAISDDAGNLDRVSLVKSFMPSVSSGNSYISASALESISNKLYKRFSDLSNMYQDTSFLGDAFYTYNRNRYHIGQTSMLWSRVGSRFDPLYSVAGFEISRRGTQMTRSANVVGFDLLESFNKELLSYGFDYDRHNAPLGELRNRRTVKPWPKGTADIEFHDALLPTVNASSPFLDSLKKIDVSEPVLTSSERKSKILEANNLGVNFWQVVYKETGQKLLKHSYEEAYNNDILEQIDLQYVQKLFTASRLNKKQLRDLYSVAGILSWLSFG